ncbi:hypothetical protein NC652_038445 [Populus alba x Populus x berolinensis]|nr:hypothetical protein NC652_038445 [Populus alba x Populus x berolinensis]
MLHPQRKKQKKNVCKFLNLEPNFKNQSINHYPMKAIILSASATARTTIFHYDVQFGRFCTNKHKGRCFLSVHSSSPSKLSPKQNHKVKLVFLTKAADSSRAASSTTGSKTIVTDDEFSLAKVSFGVIGLGLGISLLSYGFGAYFNILPGSEWSAIMLTYGFPLAIIGMALKYAELKPVPCLTYSDAEMLREKCATPILKQVRNDVIRYRYGDEQHLDEALKRIFQYGLGGGIPRRNAPILQMIREECLWLQLLRSYYWNATYVLVH